MPDPFEDHFTGLESPARNAASVTPADGTDLADTTRGLYVGGAGDVAVHMGEDGDAVTFVGVQAGSVLPISVRRVLATGTTATSIVALW